MSTNFHVHGERDIIIAKTAKKSVQIINFDVWQTPTKVTYEIMGCSDRLDAYVDWVMSISKDELFKDEEYVNGQFFEKEVTVNYGCDHIKELRERIKLAVEDGYTITFHAY